MLVVIINSISEIEIMMARDKFDIKNVDFADFLIHSFKLDSFCLLWSFFLRNSKTTYNWYDVLLLRLRMKKEVSAHFRDGTVLGGIKIQNYSDYCNVQEEKTIHATRTTDGSLSIVYKGRAIFLKGADASLLLSEIFVSDEYKYVNPSGKTIVDVGASIGDTSVWFLVNGASKIYAFEPYPYAFEMARYNIKKNGLSDKVTLVNAAVGPETGGIVISNKQSTPGSVLTVDSEGTKVPITTLKKIISQYNLKDSILKMDCEGSEYGIILNSDEEALRSFSEIILEYHYGYLDLKSKLENAKFDVVKIGMPAVGILYGKRK